MSAILIFCNTSLASDSRECERGSLVHMNFRALAVAVWDLPFAFCG